MTGLPIFYPFDLSDSCIDILDKYSALHNITRLEALEILVTEGWKYTNKQPFDRGAKSPDLSEIVRRLERLEHMAESIVYAVKQPLNRV